ARPIQTRPMKSVRPDPLLLWPAYTLFPLAGLSILVFGASAGGDAAMSAIGIALLALNAVFVVNQLYATSVGVDRDELVYRTWFGLVEARVPVGSVQRVDAKRYAGGHGGWSAPHFVARGREEVVRVNTKAYRLADFVPLLALIRSANPRGELDDFWTRVARGEDVSKEVTLTPKGRF
ncbi:MAG: hypothetical protein AABZ26_06615, partial [Chloroflexota bacterium]